MQPPPSACCIHTRYTYHANTMRHLISTTHFLVLHFVSLNCLKINPRGANLNVRCLGLPFRDACIDNTGDFTSCQAWRRYASISSLISSYLGTGLWADLDWECFSGVSFLTLD